MAIIAKEVQNDKPRDAEEQPVNKRSAGKRKSSDVFKSFSRSRIILKQENSDVSAGASHAPDTASHAPVTASLVSTLYQSLARNLTDLARNPRA